MAGIDIQAKVKAGLAKAVNATGGNGVGLVYLVQKTGGGGTPINPIAPTENNVLLVDAILKGVNYAQLSGGLATSGDLNIVANGDVEIKQSDIILTDEGRYIVGSVTKSAPAGVVLSYTAILSKQ